MRLRNMTSLYLVNDQGILCLFRIGSRVANGKYVGAAGGHFENHEMNDPKACVLREAKEELDLSECEIPDMKLRYITYRLKDGEIRQNFYYFASLPEGRSFESNEGRLEFIPYEKTPALDMPVSARNMLTHYVEIGRYTEHVYAGITEENGTEFRVLKEF